MEKTNTKTWITLAPVFFGFFIMGLVDVVGISANYVKTDFSLSRTWASFLPLMAFIGFAFLAVPSGILMNKIGRKNTVLLSMAITCIALFIPSFGYTFGGMITTFALIGIGNTLMQTSLNPLMGNVVSGRLLTTSLTLGQFFRSSSSFLGPVLVTLIAAATGNWRDIFPLYAGITLVAGLWLLVTGIRKEPVERTSKNSFASTFLLLKNPRLAILFFSLFIYVGIDVGMNVYVPQFLETQCGVPLEKAVLGSSLYFIARIVGSFTGAFLLYRMPWGKVWLWTMVLAVITTGILLPMHSAWIVSGLVLVIGFTCANVFPIIFSFALNEVPERANEVSGLLIMAVSGGAVVPWLMGVLNDHISPVAGFYLLWLCFALLLFVSMRWRHR